MTNQSESRKSEEAAPRQIKGFWLYLGRTFFLLSLVIQLWFLISDFPNFVNREYYAFTGINVKRNANGDVYVSYVSQKTEADEAGIKEGDVLVSINGEPISQDCSASELVRQNQGKN